MFKVRDGAYIGVQAFITVYIVHIFLFLSLGCGPYWQLQPMHSSKVLVAQKSTHLLTCSFQSA